MEEALLKKDNKSEFQSTASKSESKSTTSVQERKEESVSNTYLYSVMLSMLFFGTCNTVIMKLQDETVVGTTALGAPQKFTHPYFQCAVMFCGEFFCLFLYMVKSWIYGVPEQNGPQINPLSIAVPAMFDICGSSLMFIALTMTAASVYQMMRGVIVVITAFMAIQFLGRKQYAHHWISLITIVVGVFIVGLVGVMASKKAASASETSALGILLLLAAQCFTGSQFVTEEKLFDGYTLDPLYVIGFEGFWGCCIFGILLPIFQQIECYGQLCHGGRLEDSLAAIEDFKNHPILIAQSLTNVLTIAGFNVTGVMITKYASAAQRSTVDTSRTLIIWVVFLIMGTEQFIWAELFGFALLVAGTLVYNEIVVVPISFMNRNTKENMAKREAEEASRKKDLENVGIDQLETGSNSKYPENQRLLEDGLKNKMV